MSTRANQGFTLRVYTRVISTHNESMTFANLAKAIAHAEGKKHEASIGDVKEILSILSRMMAMSEEPEKCLMKNGQRLVNKEIKSRGLRAKI